jgi:8-amino-7-oxononanoate synthase
MRRPSTALAISNNLERTATAAPRPAALYPRAAPVIDEIDGRLIRIGDHWLIDFASANYLGFDLEPEIIDAVPGYRAPRRLHEAVESKLAELLGSEDALVLPTLDHVHTSVLPELAGAGTIFVDGGARKTVQAACAIAAGRGATILGFGHDEAAELEGLLRLPHAAPHVICIDGIDSLTGNAPDLASFARIAREYEALLYVDDSHGFGVVGERTPDEPCEYGLRGNSVLRHFGETYENAVLVAGFSNAYSSTLAYIACPTALKQMLKTAAQPSLPSGRSQVASLAMALEGLRVNEERGDELRLDIYRMTQRVLHCLHELGIATPNSSGYPIIEIPLAKPVEIEAVGSYLFHHGIYATMAVHPLVP